MLKENTGKDFKGFYGPRSTQVPDNFFDEVLPELSGAETKVLLYIFRRTFGFKKDADNISLSQMVKGITRKDGKVIDRGTGLSKASVAKAVAELVDRGMLRKRRRQSKTRGYEATTYTPALTFVPPDGDLHASGYPLSNNQTRGGLEIGQGHVQKMDIQENGTQLDNKTVNGKTALGKSRLRQLPDLKQPSQQTHLIAEEVLSRYGDKHSERYYQLIAAKVPYHVIQRAMSEIKNDGGARLPERVFSRRMETYAAKHLEHRNNAIGAGRDSGEG